MEWHKDEFMVSDDKTLLDPGAIHKFLSEESYWAKGRPIETVRKSIDASFCLGLYKKDQQIGFARVVTDHATLAYLCDVYVIGEYRGKRLGHFLLDCLYSIPELSKLTWLLKTTYSRSLYEDFGFSELESPKGWMARKNTK